MSKIFCNPDRRQVFSPPKLTGKHRPTVHSLSQGIDYKSTFVILRTSAGCRIESLDLGNCRDNFEIENDNDLTLHIISRDTVFLEKHSINCSWSERADHTGLNSPQIRIYIYIYIYIKLLKILVLCTLQRFKPVLRQVSKMA